MQNTSDLDQTHVDGLVQERHNSIANALDLCLSCTIPLMWCVYTYVNLVGGGWLKQKMRFH